ncbi:MAG: shikimate dehydrogenase family protein [Leucobacter sp.]
MEISGNTQIMFMLCDPVHHIRGSVMLNSWLERDGIDAVINPIHVGSEDLGTVVEAVRHMRNVAGFGVTIPHKIAVMNFLDRVTDEARLIGSVNFVRRDSSGELIGTNIDGAGFIQGCDSRDISMVARKVLHLGVGGAGRATAFAVAAAGATRVDIWNRTFHKAEQLAVEIGSAFPHVLCNAVDVIDFAHYDVLINSTPAGMEGFDPLEIVIPAEITQLDVADIIVNPAVTPLLAQAKKAGLKTSTGADMLRGQYELMRDFIGLRA